MRWWPHDAVVLHSYHIKRQDPPFSFLRSQQVRERFMEDLSATIATTPFTLIAGAIHKERLKRRYAAPDNPYSLALKFCVERVYGFLSDRGQAGAQTHILFEKRGRTEDDEASVPWCVPNSGARQKARRRDGDSRYSPEKQKAPVHTEASYRSGTSPNPVPGSLRNRLLRRKWRRQILISRNCEIAIRGAGADLARHGA